MENSNPRIWALVATASLLAIGRMTVVGVLVPHRLQLSDRHPVEPNVRPQHLDERDSCDPPV